MTQLLKTRWKGNEEGAQSKKKKNEQRILRVYADGVSKDLRWVINVKVIASIIKLPWYCSHKWWLKRRKNPEIVRQKKKTGRNM